MNDQAGRTKVPDFMIVGAVKAATTWLNVQIQNHPDVYLPDPEPHYFSREFERGPDWYAEFFTEARPGQLVGEKSADYLADPHAAERIARVLPAIPLIAQLRDPVDRAYSDYCMLYRRGTIRGGPEEYLNPATATFRRFLDNGLYGTHLRRWLSLFDRRQMLVFLFEDVRATPAQVLDDTCRHLGLSPMNEGRAPAAGKVNDGAAPLLPLAIRRLAQPAKNLVKPLRGTRMFESVRGLLAKPMAYPPMTADLRARLRDYYAPEVEALEVLLNRDLSQWLPGANGLARPASSRQGNTAVLTAAGPR
ncbi:Sulfotransferase family protein [Sphingomonas sp. OV641]|uniref:sulfotransferase family protein n=1 Tax=Sphingomonas sp. OV641 TaxID=1881068 RepID=UPI0008AAC653|nr:sulfotransferase [Sphingomonas sp. OV641]SEJ20285.1 Sulfotransferase family protein [Sphingomonas sp. OV641]